MRLPFAASGAVFPAIAGMHPRLAYAWQKLLVNLWRLDTRTGERKILVGSNSYQHLPQYSPDGRKIAFQSDRSGEHGLWTCTAEGSNCVELTTFGGTVGGTPRWSPDGRWIAFDSRAEGQAEIYVIQADGGAPRRITADPAGDHAPSWSHDGRWIYFASDRSGRVETWKIPAAGGAATQVTRTGGGPAFESADGEYVYYVKPPSMLRFQEATPLFRRPAEGGAETQILPRVWNWSLFGITAKAVYFAPDEKTLQRLDLPTRKVTTLATLERALGVGICVSPDDAFVVWPQWDQNYSDLMLVEGFR